MREPANHAEWVEKEGGWEHPTHLTTLLQPHQQERISSIVRLCSLGLASRSILEVGCNWGYILARVRGEFGIDINPENIELATKLAPGRSWMVWDVRDGLPFADCEFNTVLLPDVLEHIDTIYMALIIKEAIRVAAKNVVVTLPRRPDDVSCFKHAWQPDESHLKVVVAMMEPCHYLTDSDFAIIWRRV